MIDLPSGDLLSALQMFFALAIGHALADFPLQGEYLALGKNRRYLEKLGDPLRPPQIWVSCMGAHCLIHSGAVWAVTGSSLLALIEFVLHWTLDTVKCAGRTNYTQDQAMHLVCKALYVGAGYAGWISLTQAA